MATTTIMRTPATALTRMPTDPALLRLLQLTSPALPVGAFSYSEGLEWLVERGTIRTPDDLAHWLRDALAMGGIRVETAVVARVMAAARAGDPAAVRRWDRWLTASRESEELRAQSEQMGTSLLRLLESLEVDTLGLEAPVHFATAFALAAAAWDVPAESALSGYMYAWASNLVSAGVRLVPLGQTAGQRVLADLHAAIVAATAEVAALPDHWLDACGFGAALAAMHHETQYTRLFRS